MSVHVTDIEHAISMLQRKFHIAVKHIKMWYMGDISSVMHTCIIILHNMIMVTKRMEDDEMESESFYKFGVNDAMITTVLMKNQSNSM